MSLTPPKEFIRTVEEKASVKQNPPTTAHIIAATLEVLASSRNDLHTAEGVAEAYELEEIARQVLEA